MRNHQEPDHHVRFERCSNGDCHRPYQINEFEGKKKGEANTSRNIVCPHCGHTKTSDNGGIVITHALSPEEEAAYNSRNPL